MWKITLISRECPLLATTTTTPVHYNFTISSLSESISVLLLPFVSAAQPKQLLQLQLLHSTLLTAS